VHPAALSVTTDAPALRRDAQRLHDPISDRLPQHAIRFV
jgi:hypothetical protein